MLATRCLIVVVLGAAWLTGCGKSGDGGSSSDERDPFGKLSEKSPESGGATPMDTYNLSFKYARQGKVDALYDLYSSDAHASFDMLAERSGMKSGREFFRRRVSPMLRKVQAGSRMAPNGEASYRTEINGDTAVIRLAIKAAGAEFYPDVHLVRENGAWKLEAPQMFGFGKVKSRRKPTIHGGKTPAELFEIATRFMREGKTRDLYALYDSESQRMFEVWARAAYLRDPAIIFGRKMSPVIGYAKYTRYGEGVNAAGFRVTINGDRAILHTNMPMKNVAQFKPDIEMAREGGLWKLRMLPMHRKRVETILAQKKKSGKSSPRGGGNGTTATKGAGTEGLLSNRGWKVSYVSSESRYNGMLAKNAIDGDPKTFWISQHKRKLQRHPHTLVIDLGAERTIRGVRYLTRQDRLWKGTLTSCEFYVSSSPGRFDKPVVTAEFKKTRQPQVVRFAPVKGRYLGIRTRAALSRHPYACIAEIGVFGE